MEFIYHFFDRTACDQLWKMSWKDYLCRWGRTRWARAEPVGEGNESLRDMISFHIDPEPTAEEV